MGPKGFRQYLSDLGMEAVSAHCDIGKDFERKAEEAAEVGLKYLVCPWFGKQPNLDFYRKAAEDFNQKEKYAGNTVSDLPTTIMPIPLKR